MKLQFDIVYLIVIGFVVTLIGIVVFYAWNQLSTSSAWQTDIAGASPAANVITTSTTTTFNLLGNSLAFIWVISGIASIIATFFIESAPIFAVVGIILLPIEAFLGLIFHDFFFVIATNSFIAPVVNALPALVYFWSIYPIAALVIAIVSIIFTFVKPQF